MASSRGRFIAALQHYLKFDAEKAKRVALECESQKSAPVLHKVWEHPDLRDVQPRMINQIWEASKNGVPQELPVGDEEES